MQTSTGIWHFSSFFISAYYNSQRSATKTGTERAMRSSSGDGSSCPLCESMQAFQMPTHPWTRPQMQLCPKLVQGSRSSLFAFTIYLASQAAPRMRQEKWGTPLASAPHCQPYVLKHFMKRSQGSWSHSTPLNQGS